MKKPQSIIGKPHCWKMQVTHGKQIRTRISHLATRF